MKIIFNELPPTVIQAKYAEYGLAYKFGRDIIMCFEPCHMHCLPATFDKHDVSYDAKHFVRLSKSDTMSIILCDDMITCLGEPEIHIGE